MINGKMLKNKILIAAGRGHITEVEMIKGLHRMGFDMHAAFESTSPHLEKLRQADIPTYDLDLKSNIDLKKSLSIRRWIIEEGFSVVHGLANRQVANFIWASYGLHHKVVAYRGAVGHVSRWDPTCYIKWLNPRLDKIICVSHAVERDLRDSGVKSEKLATIYKGHMSEWYEAFNSDNARQKINSEFGTPSDAILVGMAANMRQVKGADILLEAMRLLPENIYALLIGEVRDPNLRKIAENSDIRSRVIFTGFRDDAKSMIGGLDINTAPSRGREGLTKTIIEGMAQGRPSVVSNAGGLPEMIDEGVTGFVTDVEDVTSFAERISQLSMDPELRARMGAQAKEVVRSRFGIEQTIQSTGKLYRELLS